MEITDPGRYLAGIELPRGRQLRCRCRLPQYEVEFDGGAVVRWDHCAQWAEPESPVCRGCAETHWNPDGTSRGVWQLTPGKAPETTWKT